MTSGNFIIGEQGLSLKVFNKYIEPILNANGLTVTDGLGPVDRNGGVLTAIFGENLEEKVNLSLETVREKVDTLSRERNQEIYNFHLPHDGKYTLIGIYQNDKTASEVFPLIAQSYLAKTIEPKLREVSEQIRNFLGKKVSDF